ncbi:gliding motility-associated C-terminal domain-containing protein [Hymenobacter aquaticus]|uniref:Gliding motility-associated C-terminal domain-containing protein n=1 Tax=Hymenobacter aquaticus TaxID=1867101 RepID=A0A4Z0Q3Z2_9BACT|nr:gliding motility-associated C-terminal domain-containing protein [Hymenobacter aquaticus]TGE24788.1 gliding motility-associated C-terminal domain-containing protein [Hymenobacter aquaticus]
MRKSYVMKPVNQLRFLACLLLLVLGFSPARAQCLDALPTNCSQPFEAFDLLTGVPVQSFCVGRAVRITITCPGRAGVDRNALYYQFVPGALTSAPCTGYSSRTNTFTPTQAGKITVAENAQAGAGAGTIFLRVYDVQATAKPTFQVEACSPGFVRVTITDQAYDTYSVRINDGVPQPVAKGAGPRVYAVPTTTGKVVVKGFYTGGGLCVGADSTTFTTLAAAPSPVIRRLALTGTEAQFQLDPLPTGYQYVLQQADAGSPGGYRDVPAVFSGTGATLGGVTAAACYRLRVQDVCATASLPVSPAVCAIFLAASSTNGQNNLSFTGGAGSYVLKRDGQPLATLPAGTTTYSDAAVTCGVRYCYQLEASSGSGAASTVVVSNQACATTTPSPVLPVPQLVASFTPANQVVLTATVPGLPTGGRVRYLRVNNLGAATELALTTRRTQRDSTLALLGSAGAPCYQAQFVDDCGNASALSAPFCPVVLTAKAADLNGNSAQLDWSELRGPDPAGSVRYAVQLLDAAGTVVAQPAASAAATSFLDQTPPTDRQVLRYRIAATSPGLSQPSYSNVATVVRELRAVLPTAFTPNGDGLNDVLEVKGRFLNSYIFTVVDRNGQQVFRGTNQSQVWNGRVGNEQPVPGAYVWRFETVDETGQRVVQHGTITIVR